MKPLHTFWSSSSPCIVRLQRLGLGTKTQAHAWVSMAICSPRQCDAWALHHCHWRNMHLHDSRQCHQEMRSQQRDLQFVGCKETSWDHLPLASCYYSIGARQPVCSSYNSKRKASDFLGCTNS